MNNDFAEFAQGFRERTAKRLLEFEKTLAKAQDELEKSADKAMQEARREKGQVGRRQALVALPQAPDQTLARPRRPLARAVL